MTRRGPTAAALVMAALAGTVLAVIAITSDRSASPVSAGSAMSSVAPAAAVSSTAAVNASVTAASTRVNGPIVVIGTGGLSWSDVSPRSTPALWSLLRDAATATLTVHSVHANTCPVDGWLTLSAGEQAADTSVRSGEAVAGGTDGLRPSCRALPENMTTGRVPRWSQYQAAARASKFDASLGLLGDQIASHGGCVQAIGPGAALGAARSSGIVDHYQQYDGSTLRSALATCPATLVDVGPVRDPADLDPRDEMRPTTTRAQQVAAVDARVGAVLTAVPAGTDVVLASLADAGVTERLRMIAATGARFGAGTLGSSSTRQPGLVQITDLTPTVLQHLGIPVPPSLGGTALRVLPAKDSTDQSADRRLRALLDSDQASHTVHDLVEPFFIGWALLQLAVYLAVAVLWKRGWGTQTQRRHLLSFTRRVAIIAATVPVSTFLANLLPWWRYPVPMVSVVASVVLFSAVVSAPALLGRWRRGLWGPLVVVCAVTMAVLALDVMAGSRLQLSSLMGLQPVIGGRFYGMGNVTFALFATATLLVCTAVGDLLVTLGRPRAAAVAVAAIGLGAVSVDASPSWGSDLGGPTALLPAVILLIFAILQIRLTWRRVVAMVAGISASIVLLGVLDWLRPAESRSHLGRFVQTTLDGGAWDIIVRKLDQNISVLLGNPLSLLIPVELVVLAYILARPGSRAAAPLRPSFARIGLLRPGLIAVMVMWVIGFVLNDSGTVIPAIGSALAFPLVIAIALKTLEDEIAMTPERDLASPDRRLPAAPATPPADR